MTDGDVEREGPVRPYVLTRGRSRPSLDDLERDTLVRATGAAPPPGLPRRQREIVALCRQLRPVAEVAGRMNLPVSVARILLADLVDAGQITVRVAPAAARRPDKETLEGVLHGLRRLL